MYNGGETYSPLAILRRVTIAWVREGVVLPGFHVSLNPPGIGKPFSRNDSFSPRSSLVSKVPGQLHRFLNNRSFNRCTLRAHFLNQHQRFYLRLSRCFEKLLTRSFSLEAYLLFILTFHALRIFMYS